MSFDTLTINANNTSATMKKSIRRLARSPSAVSLRVMTVFVSDESRTAYISWSQPLGSVTYPGSAEPAKTGHSEAYQTMLASEELLRRDWDQPEEDVAWANL